jgi:hypothetical protein
MKEVNYSLLLSAIAALIFTQGCSGETNTPADTTAVHDVETSGQEVTDLAGELPQDLVADTSVDPVDTTPVDLPSDLPADLPPDELVEVVPDAIEQICGDNSCHDDEDCETCPQDCGICTICGDGLCESGQPVETPDSCPEDCGSCGDGVCGIQEAEADHFCATDCAYVCGNGICDSSESTIPEESGYCPPDCGGCGDGCCGYNDLFDPELADCKDQDCGPDCGNGTCDAGEFWETCPVDCGWCGDGICGLVGDGEEPCPEDCVKPCGDGWCNGTENADTCPMDCGPCGDGVCGIAEMKLDNCLLDCPPPCGDGWCQLPENDSSCPADCTCVPECEPDWECGHDKTGCKILCGVCPAGAICMGHSCCVPDSCKGKECGDDGCGGNCGICTPGSACLAGICQDPDCTPDCFDKECGDDGCAGHCGSCDDNLYCTDDACVDGVCQSAPFPLYCVIEDQCFASGSAHPNNPCQRCKTVTSQFSWTQVEDGVLCDGQGICVSGSCCDKTGNCQDKECGSDGCGGTCGSCEPGTGCTDGACLEGEPCQPDCTGKTCGDDGCGGDCGSCSDGLPCTNDFCLFGSCKYTVALLHCAIDEACIPSGAVDAGKTCRKCQPTLEQKDWTTVVDGTLCDDGDLCTTGDNCLAGTCGGAPVSCSDGNPCSLAECISATGCQFTPLEDGTDCGDDKVCFEGACIMVECVDPDPQKEWDGCQDNTITEFQVNDYSEDNQYNPRVSVLPDGGFITVWHSNWQDGSKTGVYGRIFDSYGADVTGEIHISQTTDQDQKKPAVATLTDGRIIVVWDGNGPEDDEGIHGVILTANGTTALPEFTLNEPTGIKDWEVDVVAMAGGSFGVIWSAVSLTPEGAELVGVVYSGEGLPITAEVQLNDVAEDSQMKPRSAVLPNNSYVITWNTQYYGKSDYDALVRIFGSDGSPLTGDVALGLVAAENYQVQPDIALSGTGESSRFGITWTDFKAGDEHHAVMAERFTLDGTSDGGPFQVNSAESGNQVFASIAGHDAGFVVVWCGIEPVNENPYKGIFARQYDVDGNHLGEAIPMNTLPEGAGFQRTDVAAFPDGGFVSVWDSDAKDGDGLGVYALRFSPDGSKCPRETCQTAAK